MAKERMTLANMCRGGVQEYIDRALAKMSDNILDIDTEAKKKREISIRIIFVPNKDDREDVAVSVQTAVKLAPETGIDTQFFISRDFKSGTISLIEHTKGQIKGQLTLDDCGMAMEPEAARDAGKPVEPETGVQVVSPTEVMLLSCLDKDRRRETLAEVRAEIPDFPFGQFTENEQFIIGMQSKFVDGEDKKVILAFAGNVKAGTVEKYGDDGVSQKAAIKRDVTSMSEVEVTSPCMLAPYRTFTEVSQPVSSFIFRVKDDERCGVACALFEADGGAWKHEAKENIRAWQ